MVNSERIMIIREQANTLILELLSEALRVHPELRFGQLIDNSGLTEDSFYVEPHNHLMSLYYYVKNMDGVKENLLNKVKEFLNSL